MELSDDSPVALGRGRSGRNMSINPAEAPRTVAAKNERNPFVRFQKILGPGLITGASDDDPSGIATYAQAGAQFGYATLWTALLTFPLMAGVQYICAKIGLVTGQGLCVVLRKHYPKWLMYLAISLLFIANTINAGADIGAIGAAIHLLFPSVPVEATAFPVTLALLLTVTASSYQRIAHIFKWLTLTLFAYVGVAFLTHPDAWQILRCTFIPNLQWNSSYLALLVAILGTTISPYLFFWQCGQEVEEERAAGQSIWQRRGASQDDLKYAAIDVNAGMFFSNLVMYFIIFSTAGTLHASGMTHILTATQAAVALRPIAGPFAFVLFALGIIGTGVLAVPILVGSSSYAVAEAFGWRRGLNEQWWRAKEFYLVIAIAFAIGMEMNFWHINVLAALFWTAVINGALAPPLLLMIMFVSNNREIMGDKVNSPFVNILGWLTTCLMTVATAALIFTSLHS